jgi:hypothetical protein
MTQDPRAAAALAGAASGGARTGWLTIVGLVGFVLTADALVYFRFFGLVDLPPTGLG